MKSSGNSDGSPLGSDHDEDLTAFLRESGDRASHAQNLVVGKRSDHENGTATEGSSPFLHTAVVSAPKQKGTPRSKDPGCNP
jgi:hypothetical protein